MAVWDLSWLTDFSIGDNGCDEDCKAFQSKKNHPSSSSKFHLIILNQPLPDLALEAIHQASTIILADGGANRIVDQFTSRPTPGSNTINDLICSKNCLINNTKNILKTHTTTDSTFDSNTSVNAQSRSSESSIPSSAEGENFAVVRLLDLKALATTKKIVACGDLDSIRPDVANYLEECGVEVIKLFDQNFTDFQKCLKLLETVREETKEKKEEEDETEKIIVFGALGGRLDHEMANIHVLHQQEINVMSSSSQGDDINQKIGRSAESDGDEKDRKRTTQIYLIGDHSICWLLPAGQSEVRLDCPVIGEGCALLPIGHSVSSITSRGLQWDLQGESLEMGGLISSSNRLISRLVHVTSSHPVIWLSLFANCLH